MKTFDYEQAWQDLALPAYKQLPTSILCLVEETAIAADELSQLSDCSMPWPDDGGKLRAMFEAHDSETLSWAALVVNYYGYWRPGKDLAGDAPEIKPGGSWKFSHYADQVLRQRFNIPNRDSNAMVSLQLHEGTIRVCYSSRDMWTWHEVAPATDSGLATACAIADRLRRKIATRANHSDRDSAAWSAIEQMKQTSAWPAWNTADYMVEESELEQRRLDRMPKPNKEKLIAEITQEFDSKVASITVERDGTLWLVNHDIPTSNAIYYNHTGKWCFGWRKPITGEARGALLQKLAGFAWPYDVK